VERSKDDDSIFFLGHLGGACECFASPSEAFAGAAKMAKEDDRIVVFGSFHTVAAVMRALNIGR
jgi:dihydrofolate synthase/folylpolyglutamate synthase